MGLSWIYLARLHAYHRPATALLAAAQRGEIQHYKDVTLDLCLRNKKEALVWTETATRIFFDQHGNHLSSQGSSRNITERKQAEEVLLRVKVAESAKQVLEREIVKVQAELTIYFCLLYSILHAKHFNCSRNSPINLLSKSIITESKMPIH